jgi:hypothetical protein
MILGGLVGLVEKPLQWQLDHLRNQSQDLEHLNKGMFQDEDDDYGDEDEMDGPELNLAS